MIANMWFDWKQFEKRHPQMASDLIEGNEILQTQVPLSFETKNPMDKKRYETFESEEYNTIIFPAHMWHRVRPVKSGVRKSIVGWLLGRP